MKASRLKVHPPQQVLKARVVAEGVVDWSDINKDVDITFVNIFTQLFDRLIFVSQHHVTSC